MEVIIVLIIIGIVGYLIYQSMPSTKFEKALNLYNDKNYIEAIKILDVIFEKHVNAPAKLAECQLNLGKQTSNKLESKRYFYKVVEIRERINNSLSFIKFESIEAKAFYEIAKIKYEETNGDIDKLTNNIKFIDNVIKIGSEDNFNSLKKNHFHDLANCYFKKGTENEKSDKNSEAIHNYKTATDYAKKSGNKSAQNNSITRIAICQLKRKNQINLDTIFGIEKSDKNFQHELYYRYTINLIKNKEYQKAEKIISEHLNFQSSSISILKEILLTEKNNNAVKRIDEINNSIEKLHKNTFSTEELKTLYESLDSVINEVKVLNQQLSEKIAIIKPTLFNRLLTVYISEEQYENAINIIQKYPKFWEIPELLKNLGICCYGYASKGLLTESNYRNVISNWLTSVFSDKVILKSLDDTSWDDNYTFSLKEAIGSNYSQHEEIPINVNYDEISENNISIGATQKELLQQFETIIHKEIGDSNLSKLINDFYDKEKEALERIIHEIENDIFFATPYFAKTNRLNNEIIEELDNDYLKYDNEDALEAGIPYIENSRSSIVYQYFWANDLINKVKSAIKNENSTSIKKLNTKENKRWIEKFEYVSSSAEDKLFNSISNKISDNDENENLIPVMEECIAFLSQNSKLKHQFSNYVTNYCISKVNDEKLDNFKALSLMKKAYLRSPNNPRICKNFIAIIKFNLMDILNDKTRKTSEIYSILDWVKNNISKTYKLNSNELTKTYKDILQQLKQAGADISLFDDNNPFASILSGHSLNSQGLKMKKVLKYLKELGNEQESEDPLDKLKRIRKQLNLGDDLPF
ncbi:hypothetical protein RBH94_08450 [Aestuariibaculum sp. YM273]|uniref:hypothetical protein n=1 Tax=Aestuariibaculum sp. YM273 TaxID=3070659 RepID=UPI0027DC182C|nr:hypothetical protein [Aestuariibaculum sp. YM273]WMI64100.1 hypothetical protein RBH94_08450 [Aestuariibaculum sp. YM273]